LSETEIAQIPSAIWAKLKRAYAAGIRAQEDSRRAELAAMDRLSDAAVKNAADWVAEDVKKTGRALKAAGKVRPSEIAGAVKDAAYVAKENLTSASGKVASRIKKNLDAMDEAHKKYANDEKSQDRNRFYANRDGRSLPLTEDERTRGKWNEIIERNETESKDLDSAIEQLRYELDDKERRANNIARVDELIAEANRIRSAKGKATSASAKKKAVKALEVARDAQKIYESGDIDAVRRSIADDAEIMAITDKFNQMYDELMGVEE
jgi:hypothetical protein